MKIFRVDTASVWVGENAEENWSLLDESPPEYLWLHLKSFPSAHAVTDQMDQVEFAAQKVIEFSKRRAFPMIVLCTGVKNVKRASHPGEVEFLSMRKVVEVYRG